MNTNGRPDRRKCPETKARIRATLRGENEMPLYDPAFRYSFVRSSHQTPEQRELMLRGWRDHSVIDDAEFEFYTRDHEVVIPLRPAIEPPCDVEPVT